MVLTNSPRTNPLQEFLSVLQITDIFKMRNNKEEDKHSPLYFTTFSKTLWWPICRPDISGPAISRPIQRFTNSALKISGQNFLRWRRRFHLVEGPSFNSLQTLSDASDLIHCKTSSSFPGPPAQGWCCPFGTG